MESTNKLSRKQGVVKPVTRRTESDIRDKEQVVPSQQPETGLSIDRLPSGPGTRALRQAAVIQMQRSYGNAHVMRQIDPSVQRQEEEGAGGDSAGPSSISGGGGSVDTGGGGVEITGGTVKVHSGYTEVDGVLKANTVIAENVVGSNYTPGVGNIW
jgi:hypothetical protein